jgi:uncharacterized membrane protein YqgA involved in biofilm formation
MVPIGTIINTATVVAGSLIGLVLKHRYPAKLKSVFFQAIGLATIVIGVKMALDVKNVLTLIFSLLAGGVVGELAGLDAKLDGAAEKLKEVLKRADGGFSEGLVTAFLLFCMGSMTIVGCIDEGVRGDRTILITKSIMDGFTSIAFASTFGIGVLFSAIPLLIFQGSVTLLASVSQRFFTPLIVAQLTAVGGTMIIGLGLGLLEIKKIKVINFLPALVIVVILTVLFPG